MKLFDTHFHWDGKTSPELIAQEANDAGVKYLVCVGGDYKSSHESKVFADRVDNCWFTSGVHPHYADKFDGDFSGFEDLVCDVKNVAVGEIGLDYFYEHSDRKRQRKVMLGFVELSLLRKLPLVVHCRDKDNNFDAYQECYEILRDFSLDGGSFVVHCYTGNIAWMEKFLEIGAYIGMTGIVTFPKAYNVREVLSLVPNDKLLIETDSPYLAPKQHRGKVNFPKYLPEIAAKIGEEKNVSLKELAQVTTENGLRFYCITN